MSRSSSSNMSIVSIRNSKTQHVQQRGGQRNDTAKPENSQPGGQRIALVAAYHHYHSSPPPLSTLLPPAYAGRLPVPGGKASPLKQARR
jgi:hypothetical protein